MMYNPASIEEIINLLLFCLHMYLKELSLFSEIITKTRSIILRLI